MSKEGATTSLLQTTTALDKANHHYHLNYSNLNFLQDSHSVK